ncbi:MaoC family dehydratase [Halobellus marinus]|jgi:acyl dehydratase|uniref:MaoC family dehydratase n=1 Tax=Halobellus TaxID=1073986 RepID=UPI0028AF6567|nr:MaoC family dehydratase [Halobellus sp. DFY28]
MVRYFEDIDDGETHELGSYTADKAELLSFARRYDPQPIHVDPAAAEQTMYGGLIASGWHTAGSCMALLYEGFLSKTATLGSFGLEELRWPTPVRPDDTVTATVEVVETTASESRDDRGYVTNDVTAENQNGETVLYWRSTNIFLTREAESDWPLSE